MMKKFIIFLVILILAIPVVYAGIGRYLSIFNPFTSKLDFINDLNQSGYNITADNFFGSGANLTGVASSLVFNLKNISNYTADFIRIGDFRIENISNHSNFPLSNFRLENVCNFSNAPFSNFRLENVSNFSNAPFSNFRLENVSN